MEHADLRIELTAALRWTARLGMNEGIANHYSVATSADGAAFLMNPLGIHWSKLRASHLAALHAHDDEQNVGELVDPTAWSIHGAMHRHLPHARCVLHLHSKYATALSCLKNPVLPPIDQNTMRFYNRVAIDDGFDGMGLGDEAERLASRLGNQSILMMGQHGVLITAPTVAEAFDSIYYFEKAAETYITALATGKELNIASSKVAEKTARQWEDYAGFAQKHLEAICAVLDDEEPEYRL